MILEILLGLALWSAPKNLPPKADPALSAVLSRYTARPTTVECAPIRGGAAFIQEAYVLIDRNLCGPLRALAGGVYVAPERQGVGLIVLAHEGLHVRGVWNEAQAECYAFQQVDELERVFRLPPSSRWGRELRTYAYLDHFRLIRAHPRYRDRTRCQQDGAWDLSPQDNRWP